VYEGFLPHKKGRKTRIEAMLSRSETTVLYESPHRVVKLLEALLAEGAGDRAVCLGREISKLHEEFSRGSVVELLDMLKEKPPRGEYVVVVAGV
jgi:16S rRNA (cytidine1402-2'-O)-methyltransferase